ncbi:MAG: hypothetical protein ABW061_23925 [Polyangiaceae bacterium]
MSDVYSHSGSQSETVKTVADILAPKWSRGELTRRSLFGGTADAVAAP